MKKNQEAQTFYRKLRASTRYKPDAETDDLYLEKLVNWRLPAGVWEKALDELIELTRDGGLPSLPVIFESLKRSEATASHKEGLGWCSFELRGRPCVIRVQAVKGQWMECETGRVRELRLPENAEKVRYAPDKPAYVEPEVTADDARIAAESRKALPEFTYPDDDGPNDVNKLVQTVAESMGKRGGIVAERE